MLALDLEQETVWALVDLIWPGETALSRAVSLCEEAGEVCRAILKRDHAIRGVGDRGQERDWSANLRVEVAQVMINCMAIAEAEGFSLEEAVLEQMNKLEERRLALGLKWSDLG